MLPSTPGAAVLLQGRTSTVGIHRPAFRVGDGIARRVASLRPPQRKVKRDPSLFSEGAKGGDTLFGLSKCLTGGRHLDRFPTHAIQGFVAWCSTAGLGRGNTIDRASWISDGSSWQLCLDDCRSDGAADGRPCHRCRLWRDEPAKADGRQRTRRGRHRDGPATRERRLRNQLIAYAKSFFEANLG